MAAAYSPTVVISRDGRLALEVVAADGLAGMPGRNAVVAYLNVRLPGGEVLPAPVALLGSATPVDDARALGIQTNESLEMALFMFAEATLGEWLDTRGLPDAATCRASGSWLSYGPKVFNTWLDRPSATDDEVLAYMRARLFRSWEREHSATVFTLADAVRLRVPVRAFARIAQLGEKIEWHSKLGGSESVVLSPTAQLLSSQKEVYARATRESSSLLEMLSAPRYAGARQSWDKALAYSGGEHRDLANAAKESVSAVEGLARLLAQDPTASLGEVVKQLRRTGALHPEMAGVIEKLWGFASESPGVRHGSISVPTITAEEARAALTVAEAAIRLLLDRDRA